MLKKKDVPYIDIRDLKAKEEWPQMLEDGSHPHNEGHNLIYRKVKEKLTEKGLLGL